jgi:hypothetical protein
MRDPLVECTRAKLLGYQFNIARCYEIGDLVRHWSDKEKRAITGTIRELDFDLRPQNEDDEKYPFPSRLGVEWEFGGIPGIVQWMQIFQVQPHLSMYPDHCFKEGKPPEGVR